ncbi:hypothetical protein BO82DRAFT_296214 [Aspergillus uvarum CBS 121591]|uniref:Uncharacterized protein n=1 Tax=Aspergillus uvarum CBS 121591 TaxID=1448315 RepID=A0A319CLT5_9EURO|nr:hypothetical protein BO82DRAFT_296214 [Aspergillus uvarum CBS 121591]PYH76408.1 hypothetical protein BO82DRAFT_296214 [Aspergillus uvarum CBS 121591]
MKPSFLKLLYQKWEEIHVSQTIPGNSLSLLEERLSIICTTKEEPKRSNRRENSHYVQQHRRKKARDVYLSIFDIDPHIFIPFILIVTPRACLSFNISEFQSKHTKQRTLFSCNEALNIFLGIARKHGLERNSLYRRFLGTIFHLTPPLTDADGNEHYSLRLSNLAAVHSTFGDALFNAIELSPVQIQAKAKVKDSLLETTESVWTKVSYKSHEDSVICIEVGSALELADILFPGSAQRIASILSACALDISQKCYSGTSLDSGRLGKISSEIGEEVHLEIFAMTNIDLTIDLAYFSLRGASILSIPSIFGTDICDGINDSELRRWEKNQLLSDTTDCVTMQIWRAEPQHGVIKLRVGFYAGLSLANALYAETTPANST